jgi:hypothetical protein
VRNEAEGEFLACRDRAGLRSDQGETDPGKISTNFLFENQKMWYLKPHRRSERAHGAAKANGAERSGKRIFWPRGQHKSLERLISAKEIQGNPSRFL